MLTQAAITRMSDAELLRAAYAEMDDLTCTDLEIALLHRFEALVDKAPADLLDALAGYQLGAEDIDALGEALIGTVANTAALLGRLSDYGHTTPKTLTRALELDARLQAFLANQPKE